MSPIHAKFLVLEDGFSKWEKKISNHTGLITVGGAQSAKNPFICEAGRRET